MPYKYKINIDFIRDFTNYIKRNMRKMGYEVEENEKNFDICIKYFNLLKRMIYTKPRKVMISKEFSCPEKVKEGFNLLKSRIEQGEDLKKYLGKEILNLNYNDDLLNDWGIYHFHLGTNLDKDGFIQRTGPLLFAKFDNTNAYLIKIMDHGNWTQQEMIKILYNNWPNSIRKLEGLSSCSKLNDSDIKKLRKMHMIGINKVNDGVVYGLLGGGYTSSGLSLEVLNICDRCFDSLKKYEAFIKSKIVLIDNELKRQGVYLDQNIYFLLGIRGNNICAVESKSLATIQLGPLL